MDYNTVKRFLWQKSGGESMAIKKYFEIFSPKREKLGLDYIFNVKAKQFDRADLEKTLKEIGVYLRAYGETGYRFNSKLAPEKIIDYVIDHTNLKRDEIDIINTIAMHSLRI